MTVEVPPAPGLPFPFALLLFAPAGACEEGLCTTTAPDGNTGELEDDDDDEPDDGGCGGAGAAGHDSLTPTTPKGSEIDDNGVPAGTCNDNT